MSEIVPSELKDPRIKTSFVAANSLTFEVDQCGSRDAEKLALCLHGFPEHSFSWRYQLPMLAELGYWAWAPNLRGYGKSDRPEGVGAYALEDLMADVAGLIDASGKKEVVLIAHDWGAVIAWYFAIRQVRPLTKLIICNVPHPKGMGSKLSWEQLKRSWYIFFFQLPRVPEFVFSRDGGKGMADVMRSSAVDKSMFPDEVGEVYRKNAMQPGALTAMVNYYRALVRGGGAKRQQKLGIPMIEVPTLMIWGEDDVALTKETTYGTGDYVRDFTIRYLPRVSHWVQQEQPEAVNAMIAAFVEERAVPEFKWSWRLEEGESHE